MLRTVVSNHEGSRGQRHQSPRALTEDVFDSLKTGFAEPHPSSGHNHLGSSSAKDSQYRTVTGCWCLGRRDWKIEGAALS